MIATIGLSFTGLSPLCSLINRIAGRAKGGSLLEGSGECSGDLWRALRLKAAGDVLRAGSESKNR